MAKPKPVAKPKSVAKPKPVDKPKDRPVDKTSRPIVIDGTNHIAGRLSSNVAKLLLQGNRVTVVNSEKIMISGKKSSIKNEYDTIPRDIKYFTSKTWSISST